MTDETETDGADPPTDGGLLTNGHIERTILHCMVGSDPDRYQPTRVSAVLDPLAAVIERGGYGNVGMRNDSPTVRKSSVRRTFTQLAEKGLIQRVDDLGPADLRADRFDLGDLEGDDPDDPRAYTKVSDDARVTDWILTDEGRAEVDRLDARYAAELDELAARYGRGRGETTARVDA